MLWYLCTYVGISICMYVCMYVCVSADMRSLCALGIVRLSVSQPIHLCVGSFVNCTCLPLNHYTIMQTSFPSRHFSKYIYKNQPLWLDHTSLRSTANLHLLLLKLFCFLFSGVFLTRALVQNLRKQEMHLYQRERDRNISTWWKALPTLTSL